MGISGTTNVLQQRCVVDIGDVSLTEFHLAGEARGKETRADRIFGRLAHAQIGDLGQGGDQICKPQLSGGVSPTFVRSGAPTSALVLASRL